MMTSKKLPSGLLSPIAFLVYYVDLDNLQSPKDWVLSLEEGYMILFLRKLRSSISNFDSKAMDLLRAEYIPLVLLLMNGVLFRFLTFKLGISPETAWYGLDTKQYVNMVVTPMLDRAGDLNRHPLFSLLLAGPTIFLNFFFQNVSIAFLSITCIVAIFVSVVFYALFRHGKLNKTYSLIATIICVNFTSSIYFLPIFEMLSFTMGTTALAFLLVLIARRLQSGKLKMSLMVLSISVPMMATTPLAIIGIVGSFLYLSRSEFIHSVLYAYFLVSLVFVVQNFIFPTTNFFLNRPPGYYVAENHWSYLFLAPIKWVGSTFSLPILIRDPAPPFFHPLDSADLSLLSFWGFLAICWTSILFYVLLRTWKLGDKFPVISVIFLTAIVQLWGSEPHLQAPYLFPIFAYLFFMNLHDLASSKFVKLFSYVTLLITLGYNIHVFRGALSVLQDFTGH